jgi:hypothetical protein
MTDAGRRRAFRRTAVVASVPIVAVAAWVNYWHMVETVREAGESQVTAHIMPLCVDALIVLGSVAICAGYRSMLTYGAVVLGMVASTTANVLSAGPGPIAWVVAGWPSVALLIGSEIMLRLFAQPKPRTRRRRRAASKPASRLRVAA